MKPNMDLLLLVILHGSFISVVLLISISFLLLMFLFPAILILYVILALDIYSLLLHSTEGMIHVVTVHLKLLFIMILCSIFQFSIKTIDSVNIFSNQMLFVSKKIQIFLCSKRYFIIQTSKTIRTYIG